jgi:nascent polypeptide-associated complex subunit alpha
MIPSNLRDLERLLKRMGIKVEEVDAAYVEIRLRSGEVIRINNPTVALMKMPNKMLVYQIQTAEGSVQRVAQQQQPQPQASEYVPSEEDIALVAEQTGAPREEVVKALIEAKGDLVQAAMKLMSKRQG